MHADHVTDLVDGHRKCGDVDDTATEVSLSRVRKQAGREVFIDAQSLIFCAADSAWEDPDSTSRHSSRIAA